MSAAPSTPDQKLSLVVKQSQDFYAMCAQEEFNKITKKHSFRSFVNVDRSQDSGTDILRKVRKMQD